MFEYKFVKMKMKRFFTSSKQKDEEIYEIERLINENCTEGWRFVQVFSPRESGNFIPDSYVLIFEREKAE